MGVGYETRPAGWGRLASLAWASVSCICEAVWPPPTPAALLAGGSHSGWRGGWHLARTGCSSPRSAQLHYPKWRPRSSLIGKVRAGRLGSAEMGRKTVPSTPTARPRPPGCWNTESAVFPEATAAHLTQKGTNGLKLRPPLRPLQLPALASESWGSPHGTEKKAVAHQGQGTHHRCPPLPSPSRRPVQSRVLNPGVQTCGSLTTTRNKKEKGFVEGPRSQFWSVWGCPGLGAASTTPLP